MYSTCTVHLEVLAAWSYSPKTQHDLRSISGCPRVRKALVCLNRLCSREFARGLSVSQPDQGRGQGAHVGLLYAAVRRRHSYPLELVLPITTNQLPGVVRETSRDAG